jgi:hypothetical protein
MSHAGGDAIFDFLQICRHRVKLIFGITPPTDPRATPGNRLPAIYRRIQAASPPPRRADGRPWEFGIVLDNGQPLDPSSPPPGQSNQRVHFIEDIASLGQPQPPESIIKLDTWLRVPDNASARRFTTGVDPLGFLSASYPQPDTGDDGTTHVLVDYNAEYLDLRWSREVKPGAWVAFSFDRFWPPERESVEFIGQVQADCDCDDAAPSGQDQAAQAASGSP